MSVPFGTKADYLSNCVFDLDDFYFQHDRNALSELFYLKTLYPKMKVTLFTVPNHADSPFKEMRRFIELVRPHSSWIQLACHGWTHDTPIEAKEWDEDKTREVLDGWESLRAFDRDPLVRRGFKAPGWQISEATYRVLVERDYWVADHTYNEERRPTSLKSYTLAHPWCFHGHTWDLPNDNPTYQNGIRQLFQVHKLPWDQSTNFHFVSEVVE